MRNKDYRKFVASLPCCICGAVGQSQAAHIHQRMMKSKGMKVSDNQIVPLCHDGAGGCHSKVDNYQTALQRDNLIQRAKMAYNFWKSGDEKNARALLI